MKYDFIIFGGTGQQGRISARDLLASGYSVLLCGRDSSGITGLLKNKKAAFLPLDLRNEDTITAAIASSGARVVINCAELAFNIPIMRACIKTRKSLTDLGGLQAITQEQFALDTAFKRAKILAITGCGSTPGISNVMAAHAAAQFDHINTIEAGFAWDSNIKKFVIPYSMQSIFDEFTQAPVTFHYGRFIQEKNMRFEGERNFEKIGKQKTYLIVHSEVYSFARYFKSKKIKNIHYLAGFPEHSFKVIQMLMDTGFNTKEPIMVNKAQVVPLDFTLRVLRRLPIPAGYKEVENIWVNVSGKKDGKNKKIEMNCIILPIKGWESAGSNVDTGRTISVISQMLIKGMIKEKGVHAPEGCVPVKEFFKELAKRKMIVYENGRKIN